MLEQTCRFYQSLTYLNKWKYSYPTGSCLPHEGKYATSSGSCHPVPPKVEVDDTEKHCELQTKTNETYYYTPIRMGKSKTLTISNVDQQEVLLIAGGNIMWQSHCKTIIWQFPTKLNKLLRHSIQQLCPTVFT